MSKMFFWEVIDSSFLEAKRNLFVQHKLIIEKLCNSSIERIIEFEIFLRKLIIEADDYGIMAAQKIIEGWVSDDSYLYFRCWLIAQGKEVFEQALSDPDSLAPLTDKGIDTSFEDLLYVTTDAYAKMTGKEEDDSFPRSIAISKGLHYDFGDNVTKGNDWSEEELPLLYPKLWSKFNSEN